MMKRSRSKGGGLSADDVSAETSSGEPATEAPAEGAPAQSASSGTARRIRADLALVEQGLAPSRERARALILAGEVLSGDRPVAKAGELVLRETPLRLRRDPIPYVSRGGLKLAHALDVFGIDPAGAVALDIGASTGGFTDCLLQRGAVRVYCVDVGLGQLDWKVANDPRVVVKDRSNVRHLQPSDFPETADLAVVDVSFISLELVLPVLPPLLRPGAPVVALVKPQFEVGRGGVGKGGIVRDETARTGALKKIAAFAEGQGWSVAGETTSPITGGKGNVEFLLYLRTPTA